LDTPSYVRIVVRKAGKENLLLFCRSVKVGGNVSLRTCDLD